MSDCIGRPDGLGTEECRQIKVGLHVLDGGSNEIHHIPGTATKRGIKNRKADGTLLLAVPHREDFKGVAHYVQTSR